jgi:hypothetical protein
MVPGNSASPLNTTVMMEKTMGLLWLSELVCSVKVVIG